MSETYGPRAQAVLDGIERTRQALSEATLRGEDVERLAAILNDLAHAYGVLQVTHLQESIETSDTVEDKVAAVRNAVTALLLRGPDDGWSGRSNDVRRSTFDGVKVAAQRVLRGF